LNREIPTFILATSQNLHINVLTLSYGYITQQLNHNSEFSFRSSSVVFTTLCQPQLEQSASLRKCHTRANLLAPVVFFIVVSTLMLVIPLDKSFPSIDKAKTREDELTQYPYP
jgi:hypothetical protein